VPAKLFFAMYLKADNFSCISARPCKDNVISQYDLVILKNDVLLKFLYYSQLDQVSNSDKTEYFGRNCSSQHIVIQQPAQKSQSPKQLYGNNSFYKHYFLLISKLCGHRFYCCF
jgi:hypothetical protein